MGVGTRRLGFWNAWLTGLVVAVALAGLLLALFPSSPPVDALINRYAEPVFWPSTPIPPGVAEYRAWVFGVTGAVMGGWGLLMLAVARGPFRRGERWAWWAIAIPVACWYLVDTLLSIRHGVMANAVLNTALLVLFTLPLAGTARAFLPTRTRE